MIPVIYKNRQYWVPECWDECTPKQFLAIVRATTGDLDPLKGQLAILRALLGIGWLRFRLMGPEKLARLLPLTGWISEDVSISKRLLPVIYLREKLFGPREGFSNLTAGEFHFADMYYTAWKESGDTMNLYRFIAVLYRPGKSGYDARRDKDGDERAPFNPNLVEYYARMLANHYRQPVPADVAVAASFCYESWRMALEKDHKRIFSKKNKTRASKYGWLPVLRAIAKGGHYGTLDDVERMYFGTMLAEMEMLLDEEAEMKRRHPELFKNQAP